MRDEVRNAIENARSAGLIPRFASPSPLHPETRVRAIVTAFLRDLPEEMSVRELLEELNDE